MWCVGVCVWVWLCVCGVCVCVCVCVCCECVWCMACVYVCLCVYVYVCVCVCVALSIRQANPIFCELYYIVPGSLPGSDILVFFHSISQAARFLRGEVIEHKMRSFRSALLWGFYASSARNCRLTLRKVPKRCKSHLLRGESPNSRVCILICSITFV